MKIVLNKQETILKEMYLNFWLEHGLHDDIIYVVGNSKIYKLLNETSNFAKEHNISILDNKIIMTLARQEIGKKKAH